MMTMDDISEDFNLIDERYQAGLELFLRRLRDVIANERSVQCSKQIKLGKLENYITNIHKELSGELFDMQKFSELIAHLDD